MRRLAGRNHQKYNTVTKAGPYSHGPLGLPIHFFGFLAFASSLSAVRSAEVEKEMPTIAFAGHQRIGPTSTLQL